MKNCPKIGAILLLCIFTVISQDYDWKYSLEQLCQLYGYEYEEHHVTTQDGYILLLQRIRGPLGQDNSNREPLYFSDDISQDEGYFFLVGPDESPGYRLIDAGYDGWFLHPRGDEMSRRHVEQANGRYDPGSYEYWDFDLNDMALDHLAAIEYINQLTGYPQIHIYGYSSGGISVGFAFALYPEFMNQRVRDVHYAAVPMNIYHSGFIVFQMLAAYPQVIEGMINMGVYSIYNNNVPLRMMQGLPCIPNPMLCLMWNALTTGQSSVSEDNPIGYTNFLLRGNVGTSLRAVKHMTQSGLSGEVTSYDHGTEGNLEEYGQEQPPRIPLENINVPVCMYYSPDNEAADMEDAEWFADQMGDSVVAFNTYPGYSLLSFNIGNDMYFLDDVIDLLQQYPIQRTEA
ncbi:unnamed protein product [Moneuplotes crassus]|uniref:Partial AB-hydrolase lipase domain-containing protein n=1 Tax=Euplotes crassus TaxID=5936 RepID=A0AAD1UNB7_EUPCR|nr:unnamed protein product [Moneuplotes crassus]